MPLKIIREDIVKLKCDAIVNPTNASLLPTGGADAAIHRAAGEELARAMSELGEIPVGGAAITRGFGLPARFVIHTVGPRWSGGGEGEVERLSSCYRSVLSLAVDHGLSSVALPLISSGEGGFPPELALSVATSAISAFLMHEELDVMLVVYDRAAFLASERLFCEVQSFLDDNFEGENGRLERRALSVEWHRRRAAPPMKYMALEIRDASDDLSGLDDMLERMDRGFADTLFYYVDKKGLTDVECYKRSNVSKKTFSKIKCNPDYRPGKVTAVSFAIGLRLDIDEARHLLSTAGMCLSRSSRFDVIIEYFLTTGRYETIFDVNEVLYRFDQVLLGV